MAERVAQRRGPRAPWLWLATLLALTSTPLARAALDFEPCELRGSLGYGLAVAECARFVRAENPEQPDGATVDLFVARIRSPAAEPQGDAFTLINGGPGASSVSLYVDLQSAFAPVLRHRDIVLVDQRGTGRSAPMDCPELATTTKDYEAGVIRAGTRACLDALDVDPRFYTTSVAVADLDALRRELGYGQWNLYGVSYGTRVAQHYLRRYPAAVRTLTLDGVVPAGLALGPDIPLNAQATLDRLVERCSEEPACGERFPRIERQFDALRAELEQAPVALSLPHPVTGRRHDVELGYGHLATTLRLMSYAPETAALIPLIIEEAAVRHNFLPIAAQALRIESELTRSVSFGMHNSVVCTEDVPFYDVEPQWASLRATYLGPDQVQALQTICESWPAGPLDADLRTPVQSAVPVLLLSGENDPITPPAYAERAASGFGNHLHLVASGQGHGIVGRGCVPRLLGEFIAAGDLETLDTDCATRLAADPFFIDLMGPPP